MAEAKANPWASRLAGKPQVSVSPEPTPKVVTPSPAPKTKLEGMFPTQPKYPVIDAKPAPVAESLDDLDNLDLSSLADIEAIEDPGIAPTSKPMGFKSQFDDETPASKPTRELPPELDKSSMQFIDLIDGVYGILDDPELLGGVIRNIMIELKSNPQYIKLVAAEDIRTWVRAMRDSMGLARIKKTEQKATRGTGAGRKARESVASKILDSLDDVGEW